MITSTKFSKYPRDEKIIFIDCVNLKKAAIVIYVYFLSNFDCNIILVFDDWLLKRAINDIYFITIKFYILQKTNRVADGLKKDKFLIFFNSIFLIVSYEPNSLNLYRKNFCKNLDCNSSSEGTKFCYWSINNM